jgi:MYXO-CTERM domain-containing protein
MAVVAFLAVDDPTPFSREVWNAVQAPLIAPPSSGGCGHRVDAEGGFATLVLLALAALAMSSRARSFFSGPV